MAWHRVEEGIYQAVDAGTGTRSPKLYIKGSIRGRPFGPEATGTTSIKKARLLRADKMLKAARGETVVSGKLTMADLCDALESHYRLNDRWNRNKQHALNLVRRDLGRIHPAALVTEHHDHVEAMQAAWKRSGMTNPTINRYCNYLRRALRWAVTKGRLTAIPVVPRLSEKGSRRGKYLPPGEAARLLAELAAHLQHAFVVAYALGIRRGQLFRTRRDYVDLTPGRETITWPPAEAKQEEPHVVPIEGPVLAAVRAAMAVRKLGCPYLFHGPRCRPGRDRDGAELGCLGDPKTAVRAACRRAGLAYGRKVAGFTFHSTRHAAATNMKAGGMDEADAMATTGHKTTQTFRHYNHGNPDALRRKLAAARAELEALVGPTPPRAPAGAGRRQRRIAAGGTLQAVPVRKKTVEERWKPAASGVASEA
jgi:integrase